MRKHNSLEKPECHAENLEHADQKMLSILWDCAWRRFYCI